MARRKRQFLDDDDSDSDSSGRADGDIDMDNDPDARAERELFENPYQRKRRRVNGKDDAIYGVFGESDDEEDDARTRRRRADLTKAPVFTSSTKLDTSLEAEAENGPNEDMDDNEDGGGDTDEIDDDSSADEQPAPPRVRDDEDDVPRPGFGSAISSTNAFARGGIGTKQGSPNISNGGIGSASRETEDEAPSRPGLGGIGSTRGGIGARPTEDNSPAFPTAFGKSASAQRKSFLRNQGDDSRQGTPSAANLSASEKLHFSKLEGSFGARLMAKMGWQAGTGLGSSGEGIVTPIETKLRPNRVGIAFKGFKERTEQSKAEARRRGEVVSDDDDKPKKGGKKKAAAPVDRSAAWKSKPRKAKKRDVEHKTYEQILADAADIAPLQEKIIDATGAGGPRELTSLAEMASWTPSTDSMRIPEVRHNLRLIVDMCKGELDGLAREARALEERKKWVNAEDARLRKKMADEAQLIARLQNIHLIIDDIDSKSQQASSSYEPALDTFTPAFSRLVEEYPKEYSSYNLDHIVVASVAPAVRRDLASWRPLEDPSKLTAVFAQWQPALKMTIPEAPKTDVGMYNGLSIIASSKPVEVDSPMTAYDSLLWSAWLPKVRSSLNNDWSPDDAGPAIRLYEAWATLLPPFIRDNLLDQVVLPKVQKAVADWSPRGGVSLRAIVFPWLPHVGLRVDELLGDAKRKVKGVFRSWSPKDGVPTELMAWKDVFPPAEWENLILKYIVPKLGATLRDDLRINPRDQSLDPLKWVLAWDGTLRASTLSALLDQEFFPKWLGVLHTWLVHPSANLAEIAEWYGWWRGQLPQTESVKSGLARGLKMMDDAMALGADRSRLPKPERATATSSPTPAKSAPAKSRPSARSTEITFRALVEEHAAAHNLLVLPTQRVHEASRMPLLRVSKTVEGRSGLLVYVLDDAVWTAPEAGGDGPWRAITMDEMVLLASRKP